MRITKIEPRRQRMDAIYVDGIFAVNIDRDMLERAGLQEGSEIDEEQLRDLLSVSDRKRARDKALWLLSHRAHTRAELREKVSRSVSSEAAEDAVARMEELGMVDDTDYARRYAAELAERRGYAARRIVQELRRKGIEEDLIDQVVGELQLDSSEQIRALIEQKYERTLRLPNGRNKTMLALQRYGFSWSEIQPCIEARLAEQSDENQNPPEEEEDDGTVSSDYDSRIRYLLENKYIHSLGSEKDRKHTVNALVSRGFSRLQVERVMGEHCGLFQEEDECRLTGTDTPATGCGGGSKF